MNPVHNTTVELESLIVPQGELASSMTKQRVVSCGAQVHKVSLLCVPYRCFHYLLMNHCPVAEAV